MRQAGSDPLQRALESLLTGERASLMFKDGSKLTGVISRSGGQVWLCDGNGPAVEVDPGQVSRILVKDSTAGAE